MPYLDVSSIVGSIRMGFKPCLCFIFVEAQFSSHKACHSLGDKFVETFDEDHYNSTVVQIVTGAQKKSCDGNIDGDTCIVKLIRKMHERLTESPITIIEFIKSCTRKAYFSFDVETLLKIHTEMIKKAF